MNLYDVDLYINACLSFSLTHTTCPHTTCQHTCPLSYTTAAPGLQMNMLMAQYVYSSHFICTCAPMCVHLICTPLLYNSCGHLYTSVCTTHVDTSCGHLMWTPLLCLAPSVENTHTRTHTQAHAHTHTHKHTHNQRHAHIHTHTHISTHQDQLERGREREKVRARELDSKRER